MHPLTQQCTAKAKATGLRCRRLVIGGGVCRMHGGASARVEAARQARVVAGMARLELGPAVDPNRSPADMLLDVARDADGIVRQLRTSFYGDARPDPLLLGVFGDWLDRAAKVTKLVIDSRLEERQVQLSESQGALLASVIRAVLARMLLTDEQQALVPIVVTEELRRVAAVEQIGPGRD